MCEQGSVGREDWVEKCGQGSVGIEAWAGGGGSVGRGVWAKCADRSVGRSLGVGKSVSRNALRSAASNMGIYMCVQISIYVIK